ncbi:MFS transporter [Nonomuraea sp. B12E4]|uniref:MFS transporter n=1 Tax=Nonomuraea sp. B12E4 TaxID=3153564 RepID=UPI00325EA193
MAAEPTTRQIPLGRALSSESRRRWRDFRLLWGGQSVSLLGDQVFLLALPLVAVEALHASTMQVAVLSAVSKAPFLLIGLPAGVWVARLGLRRSMIGADVTRGLAVLSLPLAAWAGALGFPHLLLAASVTGAAMVFFQVAYQSYPPVLISDDRRLHAANTRLSFSESTALLIGPGLAGLVISVVGAARALLVDATSYLASVLTILAIRHGEESLTTPTRHPLWKEVGTGLRYVAVHPLLRPIMVCGAVYNLGVAMYDSLLVVFAVRQLHLSPSVLGLSIAIGGAGFPLGSLLARRLADRVGIGPSLTLAGIPSVLGLAIAAGADGHLSVLLLATGTFVNGVGQGVFAVNALTIRHLATPPEMTTLATAVHRTVTWGMLPIGSTIAGVVGTVFDLRAAMLTAAGTATLCMIPLLARSMRRTRQLTRLTGRSQPDHQGKLDGSQTPDGGSGEPR